MGEALLTVISVLATGACIFMFASPILTVIQMIKARSIGVMTITFFCAMLMNCCVWSLYGVQTSALPVVICNTLGNVIATWSILNFLTIARLEEKSGHVLKSTTYASTYNVVRLTLALAVIFLIVMIVMYVTVGGGVTATVNGLVGGCCSVFMLSSPLMMAKDIIKNKNAEGLQPLTMTFGTANSLLWTLYGILKTDPYIAVPNALCSLACFFQFFLLIRYGRKPSGAVLDIPDSLAPVPLNDEDA